MSLSEFEILSKLGSGAYSTVFKVRRFIDHHIYALKRVEVEKLTEKERKNALAEVQILASIKHPNIISYKESFYEVESKSLCLVMEYADSGDLWQKIQRCIKKSVRMNEKYVWSLAIQLTQGLKALHDLSIFHRDLKSANVFLFRDGSAKLGDMNVSKVSKSGFLKTQTGTPYYASPEVWKEQKYSNKSDIWSLGCLLFEIAALRPPFRASDMSGLHDRVLQGDCEPLPRGYSEELSNLIQSLLSSEPKNRPSCDEILEINAIKNNQDYQIKQFKKNCLLDPIKFPKDFTALCTLLPLPDYDENPSTHIEEYENPAKIIQETYSLTKLPNLRLSIKIPKNHMDLHRVIECSSDRLRRIKEIYMTPTHILLSPQVKKVNKYIGYKKNRIQ